MTYARHNRFALLWLLAIIVNISVGLLAVSFMPNSWLMALGFPEEAFVKGHLQFYLDNREPSIWDFPFIAIMAWLVMGAWLIMGPLLIVGGMLVALTTGSSDEP